MAEGLFEHAPELKALRWVATAGVAESGTGSSFVSLGASVEISRPVTRSNTVVVLSYLCARVDRALTCVATRLPSGLNDSAVTLPL